MLSTLLVVWAAVASAASLDRRFEFTTGQVIHRVGGGHSLNDACHPDWTYNTCNKTGEPQPACPLEQGLMKWCEEITGGALPGATEEQRKALRDCLFGVESVFWDAQKNCIFCKSVHGYYTKVGAIYLIKVLKNANDIFKNNVSITGSLWDTVIKQGIDWDRVINKNRKRPAPVEMEKDCSDPDWSKPVRDPKVGRFTLNGTTYGGDLDCDNGKKKAGSGDDMDEQVTESAAVPESPVEVQDPIGHLETKTVSIQGKNTTATVYTTSKGVIKFESNFNVWQYVNIKMTDILDADSNQDIMPQVVDGKCDDCPPVASVNDIIAAGPSTPTSDDKGVKLLMQSLPSNARGAGPIDDAAKNKAIKTVLEQYPNFLEPAIPKTVQTDKSKTPQAGAKDPCKRKRRAAFAQPLRA